MIIEESRKGNYYIGQSGRSREETSDNSPGKRYEETGKLQGSRGPPNRRVTIGELQVVYYTHGTLSRDLFVCEETYRVSEKLRKNIRRSPGDIL